MFFFIIGKTEKLKRTENIKITHHGRSVNAIVKIYRDYVTFFFIPIIPLGKYYSIYIPHIDEYYENGPFAQMPQHYLSICQKLGQKY